MSDDNQDYPWIRRWHKRSGSNPGYTEHQVRLARADNAPQNATYRTPSGVWQTTDDITNEDVRHELGLPPLPAATRAALRLTQAEKLRRQADDLEQEAVQLIDKERPHDPVVLGPRVLRVDPEVAEDTIRRVTRAGDARRFRRIIADASHNLGPEFIDFLLSNQEAFEAARKLSECISAHRDQDGLVFGEKEL